MTAELNTHRLRKYQMLIPLKLNLYVSKIFYLESSGVVICKGQEMTVPQLGVAFWKQNLLDIE